MIFADLAQWQSEIKKESCIRFMQQYYQGDQGRGGEPMHYVTSDIHNDNRRFQSLLQKIRFTKSDKLYILGDVFDRSSHEPDPVGVYFSVLKLGDSCVVVRGNHDEWLASYLWDYCHRTEKERARMQPYPYNSFTLLQERLTGVDLLTLAETIRGWPLQTSITLEGTAYLLAHAQTASPSEQKEDDYYLLGEADDRVWMERGIEGYISVCGHRNRGNHIWKNEIGNLYLCDCGCGYRDGWLGCLCLETKEVLYV